MPVAAVLAALFVVSSALAQPTNLGPVISPEAPRIFCTRAAGVHVRQELRVRLTRGENRLLLDTTALETDPATVRLQVLEPADKAHVAIAQMGQQPGQMLWVVVAEEATEARLRLAYEIGTLQADVSYNLVLDPTRQRLGLEADLAVRNNGKHDLPQATVMLPQGRQTTVSLQVGETVQQKLFALPDLPYEVTYLYDLSRFKDAVHTLLTIPGDSHGTTSLPAGKARVFAAGAGAPTLVTEAALPYVSAGEKVELDLGVAPDVAVLRNRLRSDQVNVRTDVYRKLVLFDLDEEYELELSNQRQGPVTFVLQEHIPGDWQLGKSSQPARQLDSGTLEFSLQVAAGAKEKLTYAIKRLNVEP